MRLFLTTAPGWGKIETLQLPGQRGEGEEVRRQPDHCSSGGTGYRASGSCSPRPVSRTLTLEEGEEVLLPMK